MSQQRDFSDDGNAFNCDDPYLIRIRGLPWTTTKRDIIEFFDGVDILNGEDGIHMVTLSSIPNRPLGEAYIQLASQNDLDLAHTFDRKNLGSRYIEVFDAHVEDFQNIISKQTHGDDERVLRLRGLPWNATKQDIATFFQGLELCAETDIHIHSDRDGRASGEAYVQFRSTDDCHEALKRNMEKLGHRYIEIFTSTEEQLRRSVMQTNQAQGFSRNRNGNNFDNGNSNGNGSFFGPMRDKRNSRNNARKPYNNGDSGFRNRGDMNSNNNLFGFSNGDGNNFDSGRGGLRGGLSLLQGIGQFGNRNDSGFQNDFFSNNNFGRDFGNGNRFNDNGNRFNDNGNRFNDNGNRFNDNGNRFNDNGNRFNDNGNRMNFNGGSGQGGNRNFSSGGSQDHLMFVRGMPFYCDETDLYNFFAPLKPLHCKVIMNDKGRHSGNAEVYFESRQDLVNAMGKNRDKMGSRYIELFDANDSRRPRF